MIMQLWVDGRTPRRDPQHPRTTNHPSPTVPSPFTTWKPRAYSIYHTQQPSTKTILALYLRVLKDATTTTTTRTSWAHCCCARMCSTACNVVVEFCIVNNPAPRFAAAASLLWRTSIHQRVARSCSGQAMAWQRSAAVAQQPRHSSVHAQHDSAPSCEPRTHLCNKLSLVLTSRCLHRLRSNALCAAGINRVHTPRWPA